MTMKPKLPRRNKKDGYCPEYKPSRNRAMGVCDIISVVVAVLGMLLSIYALILVSGWPTN